MITRQAHFNFAVNHCDSVLKLKLTEQEKNDPVGMLDARGVRSLPSLGFARQETVSLLSDGPMIASGVDTMARTAVAFWARACEFKYWSHGLDRSNPSSGRLKLCC